MKFNDVNHKLLLLFQLLFIVINLQTVKSFAFFNAKGSKFMTKVFTYILTYNFNFSLDKSL